VDGFQEEGTVIAGGDEINQTVHPRQDGQLVSGCVPLVKF
jgi:hypothetical protein